MLLGTSGIREHVVPGENIYRLNRLQISLGLPLLLLNMQSASRSDERLAFRKLFLTPGMFRNKKISTAVWILV